MGRRTVLLISAILVAALGTTLVFMYANRAEQAAVAGQQPVEVLVAKEAIAAGTTGTAISQNGSVELKTLPKASVPVDALSDIAAVSSLLTSGAIYPGQVLLRPMFAGPESANALSLPAGTMAMSVKLEDPARVAGFVSPGSDVAVFATVDQANKNNDRLTNLLLDRVKVVAVGPATVTTKTSTDGEKTNAEEIPTAIITLAVTQKQGAKLAYAAAEGDLHLGLLDSKSKVAPSAGVSTSNVFK